MERILLPLSEATFYILLSLTSGPKHGYAILKDVTVLSRKALELSTSTLYGALSRLQEQNLIIRIESTADDAGGPGLPRKAFQLTDLGRRTLEAESIRLQHQAQAAQLFLRTERPS